MFLLPGGKWRLSLPCLQVHAVDVTEENIHIAQQHTSQDPTLSKNIRYCYSCILLCVWLRPL